MARQQDTQFLRDSAVLDFSLYALKFHSFCVSLVLFVSIFSLRNSYVGL